jgi:hypothetical protein
MTGAADFALLGSLQVLRYQCDMKLPRDCLLHQFPNWLGLYPRKIQEITRLPGSAGIP